jgi:hypothetical protein
VTGREVRQRLVFEVGDDLLDDGVIAVLGLDQRDVLVAVGDECEVPPVGPQLGLGADEPRAADDQPAAAVGGLGDLRLAFLGVFEIAGLLDRLDFVDHPAASNGAPNPAGDYTSARGPRHRPSTGASQRRCGLKRLPLRP